MFPKPSLMTPFNRYLTFTCLCVLLAYLFALSDLHGLGLLAMLSALAGLVAAAFAQR